MPKSCVTNLLRGALENYLSGFRVSLSTSVKHMGELVTSSN